MKWQNMSNFDDTEIVTMVCLLAVVLTLAICTEAWPLD